MALYKNSRIVTENLDVLHEATGVYPYRVNAEELREDVGGESLACFDYVMCVGLSYDDHGFLGWYKQQNPMGRIIAIDLHVPSYLGDGDFLLQGDLQEILVTLKDHICR